MAITIECLDCRVKAAGVSRDHATLLKAVHLAANENHVVALTQEAA